ncbi:MAG: hypothetical protein ACI93R_001159 [Flavobacteriales bacterium]|jgi:hypothetical protein
MTSDYALKWPDFNYTFDYTYNLSDIWLSLKAPHTKKLPIAFDISVPELKTTIALNEGIHGPIQLLRSSWACFCEDKIAVHQQGAITATVKLFHSSEFSVTENKKIDSEQDLQASLVQLFKDPIPGFNPDNHIAPQSPKELTVHKIDGRFWHESVEGQLTGTMHYDMFTRLSEDLTLGIYFTMAGFWDVDKLPDPGHKALVFESVLDFLSHIRIVMPEDVDDANLPPLGVFSPTIKEKDVSEFGKKDEDFSHDTPENDWGW